MATYPYTMSITNPGAETGDMTGWTTDYGSWFANTGGHSGTYRFQAGAVARAGQYQDITIPSDYHTDVDNGNVQARMEWWWDTYATPDYSCISLEFLTAASASLGHVYDKWNTTHPADWTYDSFVSMIPSGSRAVRLWMHGHRDAGSNLDSYLDDLQLVLLDASSTVTFPTYIPLLNPSAWTGGQEWITGSDAVPFISGSSYYWSKGTGYSWRWNANIGIGDTGSVYRDKPLSEYTRLSDYLSNGLLTASIHAKHIEPSSTDQFGLGVWSYNGGTVIDKLDSHVSDAWWQIVNWGYHTASLGLDANTTKVRLWARARNTNSSDLNVFWEDVALYVTASGEPPASDIPFTFTNLERFVNVERLVS